MRIINKSREKVIAENAVIADTAFSRLKGLLGRDSIGDDEGMVITCCRSIHMFFMKFAIDVVFVDKSDKVVGLVERIKPFRMSPYFWRSSYVIELPCGTIERTETKTGDLIEFQE